MYIKLTPAVVVPDKEPTPDASGSDLSGADISGVDINNINKLTGSHINWDASGSSTAPIAPKATRIDASGSSTMPIPSKATRMDASGSDPLIKDASGKCVMWADEQDDIQQTSDTIVIFEPPIQKPYATTPINSVDDYEYNLVFKGEGDRAMTKNTRDFLMSQYPRDWSTQPPSSEQFQTGLAKFQESFQDISPKKQKEINTQYSKVNGITMIPPDHQVKDEQEREILAKYTPKDPASLTTYDAEDAKELIKKIYEAKGLVPSYAQTGENVFTVHSAVPKDKIEAVEDEDAEQAVASIDAVPSAGEDTIVVPRIEYSANKMKDPFFEPGEKTRDRPNDYTSWTPGLERMFAPTYYKQKWY
jgi:hypothetical protein